MPNQGMTGKTLYLKALSGRAEVYHFVGRLRRSIADFEIIMNCARAPGQKQEALAGLSSLYSDLSDYHRELLYANKLITITRNRDLCSKGKALINKAGALRDLGDYASSLKAADRSVKLFRSAQKVRGIGRRDRQRIQGHISDAYNTMGQVNNLQGRYHRALAFYYKSLKIVEAIGDQTAISHRLNNIGLVHWRLRRFEKARDCFNKSLAIGEKIGYQYIVSRSLNNLGNICYETEKFHIAIGYHQKAIKISHEIGNKLGTTNSLHNIGLCYASMYDFNNALKYYMLSLNIFRKIGHTYGTALNLDNIGLIHFERGEYVKALACEKEAEHIARDAGMADIVIRCLMLRARIYRVQKKYARSARLLKKTISFAARSKIEGLRIDAVMQYLKTAVEANSLKGISNYIRQVERALQKATVNYDRCFALITLIQCALAKKDYRDAGKKYSALAILIKRSGDKKMIAQTLLIKARLDIAAGRDPRPALRKARELAQAAGLKPIVDEIKAVSATSAL